MRPEYQIVVGGLLVALLGAETAGAQGVQARTWCINKGNKFSADLQIGGCTTVIQSGGETEKNLAIAFYNRGNAFATKDECDRAIADYNQAIQLDSKYAYAFNGRGWCFHKKRDFDAAIKDYDQAIQLNGKFALAYNNRGLFYYQKKEYDRAIADFSQSISNAPAVYTYRNRGNAYFEKQELDRAIADYGRAIALNPKDYSSFGNRGLAHFKKEDFNKAIADLNEALRINPKSAWAFQLRGDAYSGKKNFELAAADYEKAIELDPKSGTAEGKLDKVFRFLPRPDDAIAIYKRVLVIREKALGEDHLDVAGTLMSLAAAYRHSGRHADAIPYLERALEIRKKKLPSDDRNLANATASQIIDARIADHWAATCEPVKDRAHALLKSAGKDVKSFNRALAGLQMMDEKGCPFPFQTFAGTITQIIQCPGNATTYLRLSDGSELIVGDATNAFDYGLPQNMNDFVMGVTEQAYYCISKITPLTIYTGQLVRSMARRDHDAGDGALVDARRAGASARAKINVERRIKYYDDKIRFQPDAASNYESRGQALLDADEYDRAIADFNRTLQLDPQEATAVCRRGLAYAKKGDNEKALADFGKTIQIEADTGKSSSVNKQCYRELALAFEHQGKYHQALALRERTDLDSRSATAYNYRCWLRALGDGDLDQALEECNEALRIESKSAETLDSRGFVYLKRNELDRAIADFDAAIKLKPNLAASLYARGLAKQKKGDAAAAEADMAAAKKLQPDIADVYKRYLAYRRGWLGAVLQEIPDDHVVKTGATKAYGVLVKKIIDGSPASAAGLAPNDVIVKFAEMAIGKMGQMPPLIADSQSGSEVDIVVIREGKEVTKKVTLGRITDKTKSEIFRGSFLGVSMNEVDNKAADKLGLKKPRGALVVAISPESAAKKAGIEEDDVIVRIDGDAIEKMMDLPPIIAGKPEGHEAEIVIFRKGQAITKKVKLGRLTDKVY